MQLHDEATSKVIDHPSQLDSKTRAPYLTPQLCRPVRGQTLNAGYMTLVEIQIHQALAHRPICFTPSPEPRLSQLSIPHALYLVFFSVLGCLPTEIVPPPRLSSLLQSYRSQI